ncbi:hypothetical protein DUNSADRAFT_7434 [Dunaliella salina]|uniref:Uncharacterized protein n=1 Tax=Dunaliella salina TaxID=3046 RepID=A0ABQ7GLG9_DUNSA|nr:hypothetical protein DUNSADRAFT_7434 [Dunaliella salina]|eukprot:KAF5835446.1 hypothetical protein DUNSADRAFT_7434 [Dunaliella salina]
MVPANCLVGRNSTCRVVGGGDAWTAERLIRDIRKVKPDAYLRRRAWDATEEEGVEGEEEEGHTPVLDLLGYAVFHGLINMDDQEVLMRLVAQVQQDREVQVGQDYPDGWKGSAYGARGGISAFFWVDPKAFNTRRANFAKKRRKQGKRKRGWTRFGGGKKNNRGSGGGKRRRSSKWRGLGPGRVDKDAQVWAFRTDGQRARILYRKPVGEEELKKHVREAPTYQHQQQEQEQQPERQRLHHRPAQAPLHPVQVAIRQVVNGPPPPIRPTFTFSYRLDCLPESNCPSPGIIGLDMGLTKISASQHIVPDHELLTTPMAQPAYHQSFAAVGRQLISAPTTPPADAHHHHLPLAKSPPTASP